MCKILANQDILGTVTGEVLFGGEQILQCGHSHRVAYVRDRDIHEAHLTVQETFEFADALLTPHNSTEKRKENVDTILKLLGLSHRANTIVGDDLTRGVSGGERRRVTVGVELLKRYQLLVMDEATTGLDSSTSLNIFRSLRIVADEVAPVFATLKQPGRELFQLFDNIIVMDKGRVVYAGPRETMLDYFEGLGCSVNRIVNPADEVLSVVDKFSEKFNFKEKYDDFHKKDKRSCVNLVEEHEHPQVTYEKYSQNWFIQFYWGMKRGFQVIKNNPTISMSRIIFAIIMALIIGSCFLQIDDDQNGIWILQGAIFIVATFPAFQALSSLPTVFNTRPLFYYQTRNNYYHAIPIQIADFFVSLPVTIIESVVFATICYWMIGLNPLFIRYFYLVIMVLSLEVLFSIITKISGFLLPTFLLANILIPPTIFLQAFFCGYGLRFDRAPDYMYWITYISPFRYLVEGLNINEFVGRDFVCSHDEYVPPSSDRKFNLPFALGGFEGFQTCPVETGEQVLENSDYETHYVYTWYWFLVMLAFILFSFIIMIISSYCVYKDRLPRNLANVIEIRKQQNEAMVPIKDSIKHFVHEHDSIDRLAHLTHLSTPNLSHNHHSHPSLHSGSRPSSVHNLSDLNIRDLSHFNDTSEEEDFEDSEFDSRRSEDSFLNALDVHSGGKRIDTHLPVCLEWKNLSYTVQKLPSTGIFSVIGNFPIIRNYALEPLTLLNNVSGFVKPGMLIAFMGPSGAGKTTLLDVLAQRKTAGKKEGEILVNGVPIDPEILPHFGGYVEQNNIHLESETVEEALQMSAALRLGYPDDKKRPITRNERIEHILWVMDVLSLTPIRDALISELSLEQKKRLTIGVELAANPSLLWLDEPTSGLDSMAALQVMKAVKTIADSGVAAICTLHQPSELLFSWCTHLLLLAPGGHVAFFGETADYCHEAKEHFSQFNLYPEPGQNAADFFLDCCTSKEKNAKGQSVIEAYEDSDLFREVQKTLDEGVAPKVELKDKPWYRKVVERFLPISTTPEIIDGPKHPEDSFVPPKFSKSCNRSIFIQWHYTISRNIRLWWRTPLAVIVMILNAIIYGIILGLLFSRIDDSQNGAYETVGLLYFENLVLAKVVMTFIPQIFAQRALFYRETASKAYGKIVYLISMVMSTCFLLAMIALPFVLLTWGLAGLQTDWNKVGYMLGAGVLTPICAYGLALLLSCSVAEAELGNGLFSITNLVGSFINGYVILRPDIPGYWIWAYWIGFQHYSLEGFMLNELSGREFYCHDNEGAIPVNVPSISNPDRVQYYCPIRSGDDMIDRLELNSGIWVLIDILALCGLAILFFIASAIVISRVKHIKR